jgi:hypothetical protein
MTKINTGGPAFPSVLYTHEKGPNHHDEGMTLRDYFAGQALAIVYYRFLPGADPDPEDISMQAYFIADAMIAARDEVEP